MKTHSGENSNKCNQCDFASSQAGNLKKHMKTHSGESQTNATNVTLHLLGHTCYTKIPKNTGIYFQKSRYLYLSPIPVYRRGLLERSSGDVQTGDGSSALLSSQLGGQDGEVKVVKMTEPEGHRCSKDKTGVILHKFKLKLKERMQSNLDKNWSKIWKKPVFISILFRSLVNHQW